VPQGFLISRNYGQLCGLLCVASLATDEFIIWLSVFLYLILPGMDSLQFYNVLNN
jgi:hypothetical protein